MYFNFRQSFEGVCILSHKFSDMLSMCALNCTKMSFSVIRNAVYDKFAGVCCSGM